MTTTIHPASVEPMVAGLMSGIDVADGPGDEQLAVLRALTSHYFARPDLDLATLPSMTPSELAVIIVDPRERRLFHHIHVALEACRHPQDAEQVTAVADYAEALDVDGPDLELFRSLVDQGLDQAAVDYHRFAGNMLPKRSEPTLAGTGVLDRPEPELTLRLEAFADLPEESLGRAYLRYYDRTGFDLPGAGVSQMNHFYVAHDMTHVIAGVATTSQGEVALSGFMVGMDDNEVNFSAFLASLIIHEAGFGAPTSITVAESRTLAAPGAADLLGQEMARGAACTGDFSLVDHFALAPLPLDEVRRQFGVRPPDDRGDGHHWW